MAVIPRDGIGPEVIAEGVKVLNAAATRNNFGIAWKYYPYGVDYYLETGEVLSRESLADVVSHDGIYFGAGRKAWLTRSEY